MVRILMILKKGDLSKIFQSVVKDLEKYLGGKKGKQYCSEEDMIHSRVSLIMGLFTDLQFILFFIGENYGGAFVSMNKYLARVSFPNDLRDLKKLKEFSGFFGHVFKVHWDEIFKKRLQHFSDEEIRRLDEAIITLKHEAYLSSVVMSVSAVESRLHRIVQKEKPLLYKKFGLASFPLGTLFRIVDTNKKYKLVKQKLPEKYFSLIDLCNSYRIFSAHPKKELMNYQDSISIFGLSISFLLSQEV